MSAITGTLLVTAVAVVGLYYVKWSHYYHVYSDVLAGGSLGRSIVNSSGDVPPQPSWHAALGYAALYWSAVWKALLLALVVGAGLKTIVPKSWVRKIMGRTGFVAAAVGGFAAVPSMMCTCCAAPLAIGLRAAGASSAAAIAYWLGNPLLNPATLILAAMILGVGWAMLRLAVGLILVFGFVGLVARQSYKEDAANLHGASVSAGDEQPQSLGAACLRWGTDMAKMAVRLVPEYAVLVMLLGATRAWLFPVVPLATKGDSPLWLVGMALAGTLFVVPTAAEIPIVQAMLHLGIGAGPAGALLVTLPAISLPSLVMLARTFPVKLLGLVAFATVCAGVLTGLLAVALGL
jgi:uncharacterized membrane protein YraQ (UPF0718 family)